MSFKLWIKEKDLRIWAIVERSKRTGKVGIVMTSPVGKQALKPVMGKMMLAGSASRWYEYEIREFAPQMRPKQKRPTRRNRVSR